jgi:hypothetical protein
MVCNGNPSAILANSNTIACSLAHHEKCLNSGAAVPTEEVPGEGGLKGGGGQYCETHGGQSIVSVQKQCLPRFGGEECFVERV